MSAHRDLQARYPEGIEIDCTVRRVEPFGIFVGLVDDPSVPGFIRPREWSWARRSLDFARDTRPGETIRARVIGHRDSRLELSRRLALPNPYLEFRSRHKVGDAVSGHVKLIAQKEGGVLVILENGVEGFIPRSELPEAALREEGFGLLRRDQLLARILDFKETEVTLSVKEYLRLRDQMEGRSDDRPALRSHPTAGIVLEDLHLTLQLQEIPEPEIPEEVRAAIRRILIVEDNQGVSESLELVFEHFGFLCDRATSILQAREELARSDYDLLILDINIPGGKGDQLMADLQTGSRPPFIFVLTAVPGQDWPVLVDSGRGVVSGFFQKPTSALRLLGHLGHLICGLPAPADDRAHSAGFGGAPFRSADLVARSGSGIPGGRRALIERYLQKLKEETRASQVCVLSYRSSSQFERVAGDSIELTRDVQQNLDLSPVGDLIRRKIVTWVPDVSKRPGQFQHLLQVLPVGSFAGSSLPHADEAEYGLFLFGEQPNQLRNVSEERLQSTAVLIGTLLAEERLEAVVTTHQGLLLTGFLSDSLLHEIKNAVQAMDSYSAFQARLVKRHATDLRSISTEEAIDLKKSTLGLRSIAGQLEDLVLLFRNLAGKTQAEEVDLAHTLQRLLATVKPLADDKGVTLEEPHISSGIPRLRLEPKLLDQALLNILINAIEQMELGARGLRILRIAVSYEADRDPALAIAISDTGPGIHFLHQERIFDLFFTTKRRGTGLGLYVSRAFIEQLGGRLRVESSYLFSGSTFVIELPRKVLS